MARNSIFIDAPPAAAWAVLEDPYAYPRWVVGADRTLSADPDWPRPGSEFKVRLKGGHVDVTRVREVDPGRRIVLDAAAVVLGPARITIEVAPEGEGTRVTIVEDPAGKVAALRVLPPVHLLLRARNARGMQLFRALAEERAPAVA